jgi:hypothetical protein
MLRKVLIGIFLVMLVSCVWNPSATEKEAVIRECKPLCTKLGLKTYDVDASINGFGCIFHYKCICYPEGLAKRVVIEINKQDVEKHMSESSK